MKNKTNKNKPVLSDEISKILEVAEKARHLNAEIQNCIDSIAKLLSIEFPDLSPSAGSGVFDDYPEDWACDIVSADSTDEVLDTLDRIKKIQDSANRKLKIAVMREQLNKCFDILEKSQDEKTRLENEIQKNNDLINELREEIANLEHED